MLPSPAITFWSSSTALIGARPCRWHPAKSSSAVISHGSFPSSAINFSRSTASVGSTFINPNFRWSLKNTAPSPNTKVTRVCLFGSAAVKFLLGCPAANCSARSTSVPTRSISGLTRPSKRSPFRQINCPVILRCTITVRPLSKSISSALPRRLKPTTFAPSTSVASPKKHFGSATRT